MLQKNNEDKKGRKSNTQVDDEISFAVTQPAKRAKVDPGNKIHDKCFL